MEILTYTPRVGWSRIRVPPKRPLNATGRVATSPLVEIVEYTPHKGWTRQLIPVQVEKP